MDKNKIYESDDQNVMSLTAAPRSFPYQPNYSAMRREMESESPLSSITSESNNAELNDLNPKPANSCSSDISRERHLTDLINSHGGNDPADTNEICHMCDKSCNCDACKNNMDPSETPDNAMEMNLGSLRSTRSESVMSFDYDNPETWGPSKKPNDSYVVELSTIVSGVVFLRIQYDKSSMAECCKGFIRSKETDFKCIGSENWLNVINFQRNGDKVLYPVFRISLVSNTIILMIPDLKFFSTVQNPIDNGILYLEKKGLTIFKDDEMIPIVHFINYKYVSQISMDKFKEWSPEAMLKSHEKFLGNDPLEVSGRTWTEVKSHCMDFVPFPIHPLKVLKNLKHTFIDLDNFYNWIGRWAKSDFTTINTGERMKSISFQKSVVSGNTKELEEYLTVKFGSISGDRHDMGKFGTIKRSVLAQILTKFSADIEQTFMQNFPKTQFNEILTEFSLNYINAIGSVELMPEAAFGIWITRTEICSRCRMVIIYGLHICYLGSLTLDRPYKHRGNQNYWNGSELDLFDLKVSDHQLDFLPIEIVRRTRKSKSIADIAPSHVPQFDNIPKNFDGTNYTNTFVRGNMDGHEIWHSAESYINNKNVTYGNNIQFIRAYLQDKPTSDNKYRPFENVKFAFITNRLREDSHKIKSFLEENSNWHGNYRMSSQLRRDLVSLMEELEYKTERYKVPKRKSESYDYLTTGVMDRVNGTWLISDLKKNRIRWT